MSETLSQVLAAISANLSDAARDRFEALLPNPLQTAVQSAAPTASHTARIVSELEGEVGESMAAGSASLTGSLFSLLMLAASREDAAAFLAQLPPAAQGTTLQSLATNTSLSATRGLEPDGVDTVEDLRAELEGVEEWGVDGAVAILRLLNDEQLSRAISALQTISADLVPEFQNRLFLFEDLTRLRDPELQVLLNQVDNATLAQALRMTSDAFKERLFANMSDRRSQLVAEETELHEDLTLEEIEQAQGQIMNAVREMHRAGKSTPTSATPRKTVSPFPPLRKNRCPESMLFGKRQRLLSKTTKGSRNRKSAQSRQVLRNDRL